MAALPREDEMQLRNLLIGDAISDQSTPEPSDDEALKATILNLQGSNEGLLDENSQLRGTKELSTKIGALISTIKITFDNEEHLFVLSDSRDHNTTLVGDSSGLNSEEDDGRYLVFVWDNMFTSSEEGLPRLLTIRFDVLHTLEMFLSGIKGLNSNLGGLRHEGNNISIGIHFDSGMHMGGVITCDDETYPNGIPARSALCVHERL